MTDDQYFMQMALEQAQKAAQAGEVPVGAVCVKDGEIISAAMNSPIGSHSPTAHAEIIALNQAASVLQNYRLPGVTLYVTLEPCTMCVGAMIHARIDRLVYGADDLKTGACGSAFDLIGSDLHNHRIEVSKGILADECGRVLSDFFKKRRAEIKQLKKKAQSDD